MPRILKTFEIALAPQEHSIEYEHIADSIDNEGLRRILNAESVHYDGPNAIVWKKGIV
jgi:hypothetical protein